MTTDTTYVLVHAAWADSSSWAPVTHRLQRRGHNVIAAPLPLTSFDDDIAALNRVLERIPGANRISAVTLTPVRSSEQQIPIRWQRWSTSPRSHLTKVKQSPACFTAPLPIVLPLPWSQIVTA